MTEIIKRPPCIVADVLIASANGDDHPPFEMPPINEHTSQEELESVFDRPICQRDGCAMRMGTLVLWSMPDVDSATLAAHEIAEQVPQDCGVYPGAEARYGIPESTQPL